MNKQVHQLKATSTDEDALYFRITFLEARVRELEHLVHRLLKDRVDQSEADTWLRFSGAEGMTADVIEVRGRGQRMATSMDRRPDEQRWSEPPV
jgi:hypothetical protein